MRTDNELATTLLERSTPIASLLRGTVVFAQDDRVEAVRLAISRAAGEVFAVVDGERFVGVVSRSALLAAREHSCVGRLTRPAPQLDAWAPVTEARAALRSSPSGVVAVTTAARFVGLVFADDLDLHLRMVA